VVVGADGVGK
nr:Chain C, KRAS G12D peptide (VVVGADGVGK) [Homo sapiens]7OW4_F Chain F, KRAS G12D peptide (VVVGADGVGK) [Homo sapiens]7OW4_I Chain I, KRAS G12D peptide (VVVGADGVGK) [Homo sapiens]7OW4_L Chain L, KRAS G12D peptide (VVVGADGVGK) [Homo sapiens]7OW6_C Chain C, KRAS G12D peptide (VVVGADGVGK) [Homo sapiens]7PB2_C Chain C, KRAS G12D peptide (VVVGADGVGK) [Homo sapiens]7PB2_H Chain H, KRAS G12D peptide (VVVGADGVGK) [Homo sapiens]